MKMNKKQRITDLKTSNQKRQAESDLDPVQHFLDQQHQRTRARLP